MSVAWDNIVSTYGSPTDLNGEYFDNCFINILRLPNVSNKYYLVTVLDKVSAQHKGLLVGVSWENVVSYHGAYTALNGESLCNFLVSLCF